MAQNSVPTVGNGANATQENPIESSPGKIVRVTLYRDQALVTRAIEVPASDQEREVSIGLLPERVVPDSVYAEGSQAVEVRGVRVTQQAEAASESAELNKLTEEAKRIAAEHERTNLELQVVGRKIQYIDKLMNFTLSASHADIDRGVLNSESLVDVTDFAMERQTRLQAEQARLQQRLKELADKALQVEKRSRLLTRPSGTRYEVRLLVANSQPAQAGVVELSYLVNGCKWSPQYTIRGELGKDEFQLRYNAQVEQMSGEDWSQVQLTLSTASPGIGASGPSLTPFRIAVGGFPGQQANQQQLTDLFGGGYGGEEGLQEMSKGLRMRKQEVVNQYAGKHSQVDNLTRDYALNAVAIEVQNLELRADAKQLKTLASDVDDEVASQTYELAQSVSLDSRREQQLVSIIDARFPGSLYHVATPLLSSFAYREADMINNQAVGLLRGPATIYLDDRFVGRTEIPSIASGQHLIVGFGADNQVRTRRELMDKVDEVQGGNRRLTFQYRLVVANFKSTPVSLRLFDRLPLANQAAEISVQKLDFVQPISNDGLYSRVQKPRGILRWDLDVPGDQFGEKAFDVEYSYSVEFDRSRTLTAIVNETQIANDYQELGAPNAMGGGMGGMGGGPQ